MIFQDMGALWRATYGIENFGRVAIQMYKAIEPLYKLMHVYVRRRLHEHYGDAVSRDGAMPAHLLGNMWSQHWDNVLDIVVPYRDIDMNITRRMMDKHYRFLFVWFEIVM